MSSDALQQLQAVHGTVSRETLNDLLAFQREFVRWSARINLAAPSTLEDLWSRHILDSVQIIGFAAGAKRWLDLGSGGGFPGAVIAICMKGTPDAAVDLVESNGKKASFLQTVLGQLGAPARVHRFRIESVQVDQPDVVTARALAPLRDLLTLASPWLLNGARGLFHKGRGYQREIEESRDAWRFDVVEHSSAVSADSVILDITRLEVPGADEQRNANHNDRQSEGRRR